MFQTNRWSVRGRLNGGMLLGAMRFQTVVSGCALLSVIAGGVAGFAQERPLPELEPFLKEVRVRLQPDDARSSAYAYTYTEHRVKIDGDGKSRGESVKVTESYPGFGPGEPRWDRVIAEDGKPVPDSELVKKDAERQKQAEQYARRLQSETERAKIARERDKELREIGEIVDDVFRVYTIAMQRREAVDGHETIAFSFAPKPGATARTTEGKRLQAFEGRAWISESTYEIVRLDAVAIKDLSFGMGILARLHKGATMSFTRRMVDGGGEWLPSRVQYKMSARFLLLKRMREEGTVEFSNYKKFAVDTVTTIAEPKPPE